MPDWKKLARTALERDYAQAADLQSQKDQEILNQQQSAIETLQRLGAHDGLLEIRDQVWQAGWVQTNPLYGAFVEEDAIRFAPVTDRNSRKPNDKREEVAMGFAVSMLYASYPIYSPKHEEDDKYTVGYSSSWTVGARLETCPLTLEIYAWPNRANGHTVSVLSTVNESAILHGSFDTTQVQDPQAALADILAREVGGRYKSRFSPPYRDYLTGLMLQQEKKIKGDINNADSASQEEMLRELLAQVESFRTSLQT